MDILKHTLIVTTTLLMIATGDAWSQEISEEEATANQEFEAMIVRVDAAQRELQNGRPEAFKSLWSHSDDITLSGGFGGTIEKGWKAISSRLD